MKTSVGNGGHMIDIIFTLALFCVFAASALLVVLIGANVYKGTVAEMGESFSTCTSVTYISTKIRQSDAVNSVYIADFGGENALVLTQEIGGEIYETRIYHRDGELRELFTRKGEAVSPDDGQFIMNVRALYMEETQDHLFRFTSEDASGRHISLLVAPRCA